MLLIAHRGNTSGPDPKSENSPKHLLNAISKGFDVEVDVWVVDGEISFGHDLPKWGKIPESFLLEIGSKAWFHCKNLEALYFFNITFPHLTYFWHQSDDYTLTSNGHIWTYPNREVTEKSVIVLADQGAPLDHGCYGVCSDYVDYIAVNR